MSAAHSRPSWTEILFFSAYNYLHVCQFQLNFIQHLFVEEGKPKSLYCLLIIKDLCPLWYPSVPFVFNLCVLFHSKCIIEFVFSCLHTQRNTPKDDRPGPCKSERCTHVWEKIDNWQLTGWLGESSEFVLSHCISIQLSNSQPCSCSNWPNCSFSGLLFITTLWDTLVERSLVSQMVSVAENMKRTVSPFDARTKFTFWCLD